MKIKMLRNVSREWDVDIKENQEGEVADNVGEKLVKRGLAEKIEESAPTRRRRQKKEDIQAVPEPASIEGGDTPAEK